MYREMHFKIFKHILHLNINKINNVLVFTRCNGVVYYILLNDTLRF